MRTLCFPIVGDFPSKPMHGQYLLVQMANPWKPFWSHCLSWLRGPLNYQGTKMANLRALLELERFRTAARTKLKYRVNLQLLGVLRKDQIARHLPLSLRIADCRTWAVRFAFPSGEVYARSAGHIYCWCGHWPPGLSETSMSRETDPTIPHKKEDWNAAAPP